MTMMRLRHEDEKKDTVTMMTSVNLKSPQIFYNYNCIYICEINTIMSKKIRK
jgi:hypothetical protein